MSRNLFGRRAGLALVPKLKHRYGDSLGAVGRAVCGSYPLLVSKSYFRAGLRGRGAGRACRSELAELVGFREGSGNCWLSLQSFHQPPACVCMFGVCWGAMVTAHKPAPRIALLAACLPLASTSHRRIPHPRPIYNQFLSLQGLVGMGVSA